MRPLRHALALALLAAIGCTNDLPRASDIAHMRVLGALTEVQGDSTRSTPKPGETADLTWSMAFPDLTQDNSQLESLFLTCTAPASFTGTPVCQELIDAAQGRNVSQLLDTIAGASAPDCAKKPDSYLERGPFSITCVSGTPHSSVHIEPSFEAGAKLIEGIICRNGTPKFDAKNPTGLTCTAHAGAAPSDVESVAVYGTTPVEYDDDTTNHNPSIDAARFLFGQGRALWPTSQADANLVDWTQDCSEAARNGELLSSNGLDEEFEIQYDASAREQSHGQPEALEFSIYVTSGKIDHRFALFAADATLPLEATLHWELPKAARDTLGDGNELLRFFFTVLDGRGGYAITTRELCVGADLTHAPTP